jgi:hypothetical protein
MGFSSRNSVALRATRNTPPNPVHAREHAARGYNQFPSLADSKMTAKLPAFAQHTTAPRWFERCALRECARWLTWSKEVRWLLHEFARETADWPEPRHVRLLGGVEFDHTFTVSEKLRSALRCGGKMTALAEAVRLTHPGQHVLLFRDLLDDHFDFRALSRLWAVLRDTIAELCGHPMAALYAPLSYVGPSAKNFPLHADLYRPERLWNVFDRVPPDGSGAATLLSMHEFFALAAAIRVPAEAQRALRSCIEDENSGERFRRFYDLLHVNNEPWSSDLAENCRKARRSSAFRARGGLLDPRSLVAARARSTAWRRHKPAGA